MNATMEAKTELQALLDTALRVKNEGLESRFRMQNWVDEDDDCGTVCCLAGWHAVFTLAHGSLVERETMAFNIDDIVPSFVDDALPPVSHVILRRWRVKRILFGGHRGEGPAALNRQIRAIRWFLHRIEALEEYERLRAMPKRERRRLKVAA